MKKSLFYIALFAVVAIITHALILIRAPNIMMAAATARVATGNATLHEWTVPIKITPYNQSVVRSSPDLAYSVCLYNLTDGPVTITGTPWEGYASLSLFDAATNNIFVTSLDNKVDKPRGVILALTGGNTVPSDLPVVYTQHKTGIALIRRLAPNDDRLTEAVMRAKTDTCMTHTGNV